MAVCLHRCLKCGTIFNRDINICPNCSNQNFEDFLAVNIQPKLRSGIKVRIGDKKTGLKYIQVSREELGSDGKEAKNTIYLTLKKTITRITLEKKMKTAFGKNATKMTNH